MTGEWQTATGPEDLHGAAAGTNGAGTIDDILEASGLAALETPADPGDLEAALGRLRERLTDAPALRRQLIRESAMSRLSDLGVRSPAAVIDAALSGLGAEAKKGELQGSALALEDPEPWPDPVDGAELLGDIVTVATRFLILPPGGAEAIALWAVHTYLFDTGDISPRLCVSSPAPRCAKTRVLQVLQSVAARPVPSANITAAALFRTVEQSRPTLLVDEADTFIRESDELRGVLNSGHARSAAFVIRTVGDDHEARHFSTWAPVAIAIIGKLPQTLADRSIVIPMRRKTRAERVERLRGGRLMRELAELRRRIARWAEDHREALRESDPETPETLDDRAADNWGPLIAIADLAGGQWPELSREVALALSADRDEADGSWGIQLLGDLRDLFASRRTDRLRTETILDALHGMETRPWPEYGRRGKPITARQLSNLLKPFGATPRPLRIGSEVVKGYALEDLEDAIRRYSPAESVTAVTTASDTGLRESQSVTEAVDVTDAESPNPKPDGDVTDVTDTDPPPGGMDMESGYL